MTGDEADDGVADEGATPDSTVLVVDPDEQARARTVAAIQGHARPDAQVREAGSAAAARAAVKGVDATDPDRGGHLDSLVTEYDLGDGTGIELAATVREQVPDAGCVLYTAADDAAIETGQAEGTVVEYVPKPTGEGDDTGPTLLRAALTATTESSQAAYPLPEGEADRLAALAVYTAAADDPALAPALDRVVELAAAHFGAEAATVTLVGDHHQEVLAERGPEPVPPADREDSVATFAILNDEVLAVPDVREDPRFADNDTLADLGVRAYLGAPLVTPGGHAIGAVSVHDDQPREFSASDRAYLATLADLTVDLLVLGRDDERDPATEGGRA